MYNGDQYDAILGALLQYRTVRWRLVQYCTCSANLWRSIQYCTSSTWMDIDTIQQGDFVNDVRSNVFEELVVAETDGGCCSDCNQGIASIGRYNQGVAIRALQSGVVFEN